MPRIIRASAPGRVEDLGNHTDYNDGFVIAAAINAFTTAEGELQAYTISLASKAKGNGGTVPLTLLDTRDPKEIKGWLKKEGIPDWLAYPLGVAYFLKREGATVYSGFSIEYGGDLPLNAGLSSSASIEVATLNILKQLFPFEMSLEEEALLCQRAENEVADAKCGNMDQFAVLNGGVMYLDCRTLETESLSLPEGYVIGVINTGVKHEVAAKKEYPARRDECERAAKYLGVSHLRDVSEEGLREAKEKMDEVLYRRAFHVVTENDRVQRARRALLDDSMTPMSKYDAMFVLMRQSHMSSKDNFENSCLELDTMAQLCWNEHLAARLSGGGFGGSVIAVVKKGNEAVLDKIVGKYNERMRGEDVPKPTAHVFEVAEGAYLG